MATKNNVTMPRLSAKQKAIILSLAGSPLSRLAIDAIHGKASSTTWCGATELSDDGITPKHVKWDEQARRYEANPGDPTCKGLWRWVSLLGHGLVRCEKRIGPSGRAIDYFVLEPIGEQVAKELAKN